MKKIILAASLFFCSFAFAQNPPAPVVGPQFNGMVKSGLAVPLTGTVSETVLATSLLPANALGANGLLRITTLWTMTNSATAKTPRIRLGGIGGTIIATLAVTTSGNTRMDTTLISANATNAQHAQSFSTRGTDLVLTDSADGLTAVDMTTSQSLVITGQLASAGDTMTLVGYVIETFN